MDSFLSLASGNPSTTRGQVARALADYRRVVDSLSLGVGSALPQRLHGSTSTGPREDDQLSYVVYGLETDVTGIRVWPEPDADTAGSFPGAGNLVVDVYLDAQRQTGASARVEGQVFDDVATRHGIDSDIVIRAPVAGVRLRARPYLHWQGGSSVPALRFRVIETTLFKRLSADGLDTEVLAPSDIDIVSSS